MAVINESNPEKTKILIKKARENKEKPIIVKAQNYEYNRKIMEYGKFDIFLSPELTGTKDKLKQMDSGLDYILAREAAKNKIAIGIDLAEIEKLEKKEKAVILARIAQNLRIARKAKAQIRLLNYKDKKDSAAFLTSLGASSQQTREAF